MAEGPREGMAATDIYEPTNRVLLANNLRLDRNVISPIAEAYDTVTPALVQHLIGNGLQHLDLPKDFANYVLQGDVDRGLETLGRFTLNTVLGAGGLLDPATEFGLPRESTDFGITLGKYGVGEGPYIILPLLGPSNVRDFGGFVVDRAFNPMTYFSGFPGSEAVGPGLTGLGIIDRRNRSREFIDDVFYNSADPYVTIRSGYLQRRRAKVAGEEGAVDNLPDIFDDEEVTQ